VDRTRLIEAVKKTLRVEYFEKPAEISIVLTNDEQIQKLNREYGGIDRPTDVLAFSQLEGEPMRAEVGPVALGDIVISVETAKRQAAERGHSTADELDLLAVHGVLHLLGYDDQTEAGAAEMRRRESAILGGIENGRAT